MKTKKKKKSPCVSFFALIFFFFFELKNKETVNSLSEPTYSLGMPPCRNLNNTFGTCRLKTEELGWPRSHQLPFPLSDFVYILSIKDKLL